MKEIKQSDINLLFQQTKHIYSKVEILDKDFRIVGRIEGQLVSDSYNVDANSDVRRTYSCTLQITDKTVEFNKYNYIWFDKYIRPYVGIYDLRQQKIVWYLKGTFSSQTVTHKYSDQDNTLSLQCNDMMCRLNGTLDGVFPINDSGDPSSMATYVIKAGTDIRDALIAIIGMFGFTKVNITDLPRDVQADREFTAGSTGYDMIKALMEYCPNYEAFFDINGVFTVQKMPCYVDAGSVYGTEIFNKLIVSQDSYNVSFTAKNCIEVWGKSYDQNSVDRYDFVSVTYANNIYTGELDEIEIPAYDVTYTSSNPNVTLKSAMFVAQIMDTSGTYQVTFDPTTKMWRVLGGTLDKTFTERDAKIYWGISYNITLSSAVALSVTVTPTEKIQSYMVFALKVPAANQQGFQIKLIDHYIEEEEEKTRTLGPFNVVDDYDRPIKANTLQAGKTYVFQYRRDPTTYAEDVLFMGDLTMHAIYKNTDDSSPFSVNNMGGEYWAVLSGGEYDAITSNLLAMERAMYECYYKANLNEQISFTIIDIPWLDVNEKIHYKRACYDKTEEWIINSISSDTLSGTCNISLSKYYPEWNQIFQQAQL